MVPLLCTVLVLLTAPLAAQACGVKGHYNLRNSVPGGPPSGDMRIDTGWQTTVPLVTPNTNSQSNGACFSTTSCTTVANYGFLRATASGSAAACGSGVSLWLTQWIGGEPTAQFRDTVQVLAPSLPAGTPVQLRGTVQLSGFTQMTGNIPQGNHLARFWVGNSFAASLTNSYGAASVTVTVPVGQSIPINGLLQVDLRIIGVEMGGTSTGSIACDLAATFDLTPLTPGVVLQSCSGASYNGLAAQVTPIGTGCGAVPPSLTATLPTLGGVSTMNLVGAPANAPVFHGYSLGPAVATPFGGCVLQIDPATAVLDFAGAASSSGQLAIPLAIPVSVNLLNFRLTAQSLPLSTGGPFLGLAELSNGVQLRIGY